MRDIETNKQGQIERSWWAERTPLEKVGAVALGVVAGVAVGVMLFPSAAAATAGGALTASGALLLKKGFGK